MSVMKVRLLKHFWLIGVLLALVSISGYATVAQSPLFLSITNDPNVLLNMSIESPMGGAAYTDQKNAATGCAGLETITGYSAGVCYSKTQTYLGYFDPNKCYSYVTNSTANRFEPVAIATNHECSGKFSGNFMNWATMTAIDMFALTMTGGNRIVDTTNETVIKRARAFKGYFQDKAISSTYNVTPSTVTPWNNSIIFIRNINDQIQFGTTMGGAEIATYDANTKVCMQTSTIPKENNCVAYNGAAYYKPEGLIQKNADHMRFGVTSYTNSSDTQNWTSPTMDGGVLRANIKYVGTVKPNGSGGYEINPYSEINADGTLNLNPNPADIVASVGANKIGLNKSGVIPYINRFSDAGYKQVDPASELFYESIRYFKNLGPTAEYLNGDNGGFPILPKSRWEDPILQRCQKNFIVAINDSNPWADLRLPGTTFKTSTFNGYSLTGRNPEYGEPSTPDTDINVTQLTNTVGDLQGITGTSQCIGCTANDCPTNGTNSLYASKKIIPHLGEVVGTCPGANRLSSYYIAGLAYYANTQDIRKGTGGAKDFAGKQTISTFIIDTLASDSTGVAAQMNMLWLTGKYGGFVDLNGNDKPDLLSEWDTDNDDTPDNYVLASAPEKMVAALNKAFQNIENQKASFSALASNSTQLNTSSLIYQASFDTRNNAWAGELMAYRLGTAGSIGSLAWQASQQIPAENNRKIFSYNPQAVASKGIEFEWVNLNATQKTALDPITAANTQAASSPILDYVRGDQSGEIKNGGSYRNRSVVLGDIVNSNPWYVGNSEDFGYSVLPDSEGTSYSSFRFCKRKRNGMLYVGANDGMLHALNAESGAEVFSYIPDSVIPSLNKLTSSMYGCNNSNCISHEFFVDGSPRSGDAYIKDTATASPMWRTLLLGSTGAGNGKSVFAIDVTYLGQPNSSQIPSSCPAEASSTTAVTSEKVRWEVSPTQAPKAADLADASGKPGFANNLGRTMAQPVLVRMQDGSWAAIVANGYDSANKKAVLFILDAANGQIIRSFDTGKGSTTTPNGLSSPIPVDVDNDRIVDYIYAGDLLGNLWKFDVTSSNSSNWKIAFSTGSPSMPAPLFTACSAACDGTNFQAITVKPQVGRNPAGGLMVYFGTGKYFESGDQVVGNTPQVQSFYGIRDNGAMVNGRGVLQQQSIIAESLVDFNNDGTNDVKLRATSDTVVDYAGAAATSAVTAKLGWYMDLAPPVGNSVGERVVSNPVLRGGRIIFVTLTPSIDSCVSGGTSWFMEMDAVNGKRLPTAGFDVNNDGYVNENDKSKLDTNSNGVIDTGDQIVGISGKNIINPDGSSGGIIQGVTIINCPDGTECKYTGDSKTNVNFFKESSGEDTGRQSWRQIH